MFRIDERVEMKVFHGTKYRNIDEFKDLKKRNNLDFGHGIYFTTCFDQAKKWSCKHSSSGAVYECAIDLSTLSVLNLTHNVESTHYLLYLCRIDLENVAEETINGFNSADVIIGLFSLAFMKKLNKFIVKVTV